ncbi:hypothetical protein EJB05_54983 [Eragrostis curvula]|uniref:Sulfotransferase n=1 Tax=Eragrostis curvula TaxID=38414 RepID=A0A5J9SKY2_9POAL|nr:hypothetical protein EJB05_54983 [Eragrostis curvula]
MARSRMCRCSSSSPTSSNCPAEDLISAINFLLLPLCLDIEVSAPQLTTYDSRLQKLSNVFFLIPVRSGSFFRGFKLSDPTTLVVATASHCTIISKKGMPSCSTSLPLSFLKKLYTNTHKHPRSCGKLCYSSYPDCKLVVSHDDYSLLSKLPRERTSVVTILRNPVYKKESEYWFPVLKKKSLNWPGFVEFDDVNGKLLTYSAQNSIYTVFHFKNNSFIHVLLNKFQYDVDL